MGDQAGRAARRAVRLENQAYVDVDGGNWYLDHLWKISG